MARRVHPVLPITNGKSTVTRIGITGSPGTGKKSLARELSSMTGLGIVSLNEIAIQGRYGRWHGHEFEVDLDRLKRRGVDTSGRIVVGHLLPQVVIASKLDYVAILRCSPRVLQQRYARRGYTKQKSDENVTAEVLDIVSYSALKRYGKKKVAEFDTTRVKNPRNLARKVVSTFEGKRPMRYGFINWSRSATKPNLKFLETMRAGIANRKRETNGEK